MAYPVGTRTTGTLITAAIWNADIRDNLNATTAGIVTTAGDIGYATAANVIARRAIGSTANHLSVIGGVPVWSDAYSRVITDQALTNVTGTTYQDATNMGFSIAASETWIVFWFLYLTGGNGSSGAKFTVTCPAATTLFVADGSIRNTGAATVRSTAVITTSATDILSANDIGSVAGYVTCNITNGANAGTVRVQFAQQTSNAAATTLKAGSWMMAIRTS